MTTLTTLDILKKGRELIADPARWTQRTWARSAKGNLVNPLSDGATCFCSLGALGKVSGEGRQINFESEAVRLLDEQMEGNVGVYNDEHTHPEVLAAWDRAIAAEEAKQ